MKKMLVLGIAIILIVCGHQNPHVYKRNGIVKVDRAAGIATFTISNDEYEWQIEKGDCFWGNDAVAVFLHDAGTPEDKTDDIIVSWAYSIDD